MITGVARAAQSGGGIDGGHPGLLLSQEGSECCLNYCLITVWSVAADPAEAAASVLS